MKIGIIFNSNTEDILFLDWLTKKKEEQEAIIDRGIKRAECSISET